MTTPCHAVSAADVTAFSQHLRTQPQCQVMLDETDTTVFVCSRGPAVVGFVAAHSEAHCSAQLEVLRAEIQ